MHTGIGKLLARQSRPTCIIKYLFLNFDPLTKLPRPLDLRVSGSRPFVSPDGLWCVEICFLYMLRAHGFLSLSSNSSLFLEPYLLLMGYTLIHQENELKAWLNIDFLNVLSYTYSVNCICILSLISVTFRSMLVKKVRSWPGELHTCSTKR